MHVSAPLHQLRESEVGSVTTRQTVTTVTRCKVTSYYKLSSRREREDPKNNKRLDDWMKGASDMREYGRVEEEETGGDFKRARKRLRVESRLKMEGKVQKSPLCWQYVCFLWTPLLAVNITKPRGKLEPPKMHVFRLFRLPRPSWDSNPGPL